MTSMALAALFWIALHLGLAGPLRPGLAEKIGDNGFRGVFSLLSAVGLVWLILAFRAAPFEPLYSFGPGGRHLAMLLMLFAAIFMAAALSPANPTMTGAERLVETDLPVVGMTRITRHPMLWSFTLWAVAHAVANGDQAGLLLFGAVFITAVNGMVSIDTKMTRRLGSVYEAFMAQTSRVPFLAILQGRQRLVWRELSILRLAGGVVLFGAMLVIHGWVGRPLLSH